jgi:ArsR family transcriptional regulator
VTRPLYEAKADFFRTLGHPARIRVLELLCEREHAVHELLAEIEIEPSNLSHQLAVLRRTGLVSQSRREGQVFYTISAPEIRELLLVSRKILLHVITDQDSLKRELSPRRRQVS